MNQINRRKFLGVAAAAGAGLALAPTVAIGGVKKFTPIVLSDTDKPALLGGSKVHPDKFPAWPVYDGSEEQALIDALKTGKWGRLDGRITSRFEEEYAQMMGMKSSLAVANGTTALFTMLGAVGIGMAAFGAVFHGCSPFVREGCVDYSIYGNGVPVVVFGPALPFG